MKSAAVLILVLLLFSTTFGNLFTNSLVNASDPGSAIAQTYYVRATVLPHYSSSFSAGLEGHISGFGLNFSAGTVATFNSGNLLFGEELYLAAGVNLGSVYLGISGKTSSSEIFNLGSYSDLKVSAGLVSMRKTDKLVNSWSRFELSYIHTRLLEIKNGALSIVENPDWLDAQLRLKLESYENGYFYFYFLLKSIKGALEGSFDYEFGLALPLSNLLYVGLSQKEGKWIFGGGISFPFLNASISYGEDGFLWKVSAQF
ncbi:hypothetical protein [Fervidobacterium thailandense]|uniref:Uncharacterized protein n=1 Tax=Fervidobacterium thailandense TaxID=1008305 RepID=A0A1E3G1W4_9BACT|nr:hypothetical protein [Fervidobacterium thailandense]ODN30259.1 hypothetical protein A4H02_06080 [Fervidobacterium thailandense]